MVMHDLAVPGSRANIDHLVIGRTGVWVVDTKTTRARVTHRWRSVRLGHYRLDPDPSCWEASIVADRLGVSVRPIIAVHGDGLPRRGAWAGRVKVVGAESLVRALRSGRRRLSTREIADLAERAFSVFAPALSDPVKGRP
jgi:hypothetical protein